MPRGKAKKPTAAEERLNALLGLTTKIAEVHKSSGNFYAVTEDEIQKFRQAQGFIYFLEAPALFHHKKCKRCGDEFLVSRMFVAFCSYTCIEKDLEAKGFEWRKGQDIEALVQDPQVYNGQEPIWIREPLLGKLRDVWLKLSPRVEAVSSTPSSPTTPVSPEKSSTSTKPINPEPDTDTSSAPSITTGIGTTGGTTLSKKKEPKRKVTFGP